MDGMSKEWKPPKEAADVFAQYKAHVEGQRDLKPEMEKLADQALADGATVGQLARHTGLTPEVFRRRARALGIEHKRPPTVGKLQPVPEPATPPRRITPLQRQNAPTPEPRAEERPLTDEEVAEYAALAQSRANEQERKKLEQDTSGRPDRLKDFIVFSSAMGMGLLTHNEVYGPAAPERPVSSEEPTT